jgi:site-specific recombinase XerD
MLDHYFHCPRMIARLRVSPFAEQLEAFSSYLHARSYAPLTVRNYVRDAVTFTRWIAARKMSLGVVDERVIRSFVRYQSRHWYQRPVAGQAYHVRASLWHFLGMLRSSGHAPPVPGERPGTVAGVVAEYDRYLLDTCGLAFDTRLSRTRFAREFLRATFGTKAIRWERLQPKHLRSFVASFGRSGRIASGVVAASSLRGFLRWLVSQGQCSPSLIPCVPSFHRCKYTSLSRVMTDHQLRSFLASFDRSTPVGRRDYAMALCQAHLGLRVGEVLALTIDDIDWRNATIRIGGSKTRRGRMLPLLASVGRAIANYLRRGRPDTDCRHLFVRYTFPVGSQVSRAIIIEAFAGAFAKVAGCEGWRCTHVLRYTAATRMYRRGASLKEIADLLGHESLDTTAMYTKVDQARLATVALPWPKEVQP